MADLKANQYSEFAQELREKGYVIIPNVFDGNECNEFCDSIASSLNEISPELNIDISNGTVPSWGNENTPGGPRSGLFQSFVSTFPAVLRIRSHPRICQIFREVYSYIRDKEITEFFTSMDGINVRPHMAPFHNEKTRDWPHLDQTRVGTDCIQGQVVLCDTSAGFRCTPYSHLIHSKILEEYKVKDIRWYAIPKDEVENIKDMLAEKIARKTEKRDGDKKGSLKLTEPEWQIPVIARRGSVILWFSTTIHSAMIQRDIPMEKKERWDFWRMVVYVCHRPKEDVKNRKVHSKRLRKCLRESRVTNHEGAKLFPLKFFRDNTVRNDTLTHYTEHPEEISELFDYDLEMLRDLKRLISE